MQLNTSRRRGSQPESLAPFDQPQPGHDARAPHRDASQLMNLGVFDPTARASTTQTSPRISFSTESRHNVASCRASLEDITSSPHKLLASLWRPRNKVERYSFFYQPFLGYPSDFTACSGACIPSRVFHPRSGGMSVLPSPPLTF